MKNLFLFITLLYIGLSCNTAFAQKGEFSIDRFDALAVDGQVQLTCVISSGSTCAGINIYRADNHLDFQLIGNIAGICGNSNAPVQYNFVDEHPILNQTSFYKLELGGIGFTEAISITVRDLGDQEIRIQPNPAQNQTTIYFSNSSFALHTLNVLDYKGKTILQLTTKSDFFSIDVSKLPTGYFPIIISVQKTNERKIGVLVVKH